MIILKEYIKNSRENIQNKKYIKFSKQYEMRKRELLKKYFEQDYKLNEKNSNFPNH